MFGCAVPALSVEFFQQRVPDLESLRDDFLAPPDEMGAVPSPKPPGIPRRAAEVGSVELPTSANRVWSLTPGQ